MAKQIIISAMEEVFGEYILNMSKENMKIAALRGKIKLENVQLDGDLLGSHVMGAFGLQGFGILSCHAESLVIHIPWKKLEREPTKFEVRGVHMVCVPLIASTANKVYGNTRGESCTLRTKAKRLLLARLERNFWNGQIPNEGPPLKRVVRAAREVQREMKKDADFEDFIKTIEEDDDKQLSPDDLPEIPRDWKVKLREKVLRNLEASMYDVHLRCEVAEGSLHDENNLNESRDSARPAEKRSFAFGFTLDSLIVRTASETWKVGSHDTRNPVDGSAMSSVQGHLGPNEYVVKNNKIGFFQNLSMYWDDEPPILLCETDLFNENSKQVSLDKLHSRVAQAMHALFSSQEPGRAIREKLFQNTIFDDDGENHPHHYIVERFSTEIRSRSSDRTKPGPISCSADVLPFHLDFNIRPNQFRQYLELKSAIETQQRLDTMSRQRPAESPLENPRAWWKYAISCVIARPHSRPWEEIVQIGKYRALYVQLVSKKNTKRESGGGYHSGLSKKESETLLEIENFMPNEALEALHLVALRRAYGRDRTDSRPEARADDSDNQSRSSRQRRTAASRFRILPRSTSKPRRPSRIYNRVQDGDDGLSGDISADSDQMTASENEKPSASSSLMNAMNLRLGKKVWFVNWKIHDAIVNIRLLTKGGVSHSHLSGRLKGSVRSFGKGRRDFFIDVSQLEAFHGNRRIIYPQIDNVSILDSEFDDTSFTDDSIASHSVRWTNLGSLSAAPDLETPGDYLDLPPDSIVCRIVAGRQHSIRKFSVSAHSLVCVWKSSFFDGILSYLPSSASLTSDNIAKAVRDAATPLARKARMSMLSPGSTAFFLNIQAPRIWVPITTDSGNAVVHVEAGNVTATSSKDDTSPEPTWNFSVSEIQANFVRHDSSNNDHWLLDSKSFELIRDAISIVKPFEVTVSSIYSLLSGPAESSGEFYRVLNCSVSPMFLNLVDAEVLARAFGKVYARNMHRARMRQNPLNVTVDDPNYAFAENSHTRTRRIIVFELEEAQIVIEGHSKAATELADDRSSFSIDTAYEAHWTTRTYKVTMNGINLRSTVNDSVAKTQFRIHDVNIVRLAQPDRGKSFALPDIEQAHRILQRADPASYKDGVQDNLVPLIRVTVVQDKGKHLDEVAFDFASVVMRVTPTTLKDSTKAFRKFAELAQVVTGEMERKVHEEGRRARRRENPGSLSEFVNSGSRSQLGRPDSPVLSETYTDISLLDQNASRPFDSSIVFRISLKDCTLLAGKPTQKVSKSTATQKYAVVQVVTEALILLQSIENHDGSGAKTLHISLNELSSLVNTNFDRVSPTIVPPMIGPTGMDLRIVYTTESPGSIVSQDISVDLGLMRACLTPNDLMVTANVTKTMIEKLIYLNEDLPQKSKELSTAAQVRRFAKMRRSGVGIATYLKVDLQELSFVLLRPYKSKFGAPEFLKVSIKSLGGRFDGCVSALAGDFGFRIAIGYFKPEIQGWEDVLEETSFGVHIDQMPDEIVAKVSSEEVLFWNFTGQLLRDLVEMKVEILRDRDYSNVADGLTLNQSALSTVGLRRATEARSVKIQNRSGIDLHVHLDSTSFDSQTGFIPNNASVDLETDLDTAEIAEMMFVLRCATSSREDIGERAEVYDLPLLTKRPKICLLNPRVMPEMIPALDDLSAGGRTSPESVAGDKSALAEAYYRAEPVVEFCMQNQRLKSSVDFTGIPKGTDLLSTTYWAADSRIRSEEATSLPSPLETPPTSSLPRDQEDMGNWSKPFLKNDVPEFSDMTFSQSLSRERVMLPDNNWIWANEWTVDLVGNVGESSDSDGWEYAEDFDFFGRKRRYYGRGDTCRRRRWVRTRLIRPPSLDDHSRLLRFVWDTHVDKDGNYHIEIRSKLRVTNSTMMPLAIFLTSPTWEAAQLAGKVAPSQCLYVPITLASATYMRLAKVEGNQPATIENSICSEQVVIIPTQEDGSNFLRVSMDTRDVSGTKFHFLVEVRNAKGLLDISVHPVIRIVNLLPCQLDCSLGEVFRPGERRSRDYRPCLGSSSKGAIHVETVKIPSGNERSNNVLNPRNRPHISLRVPGYNWSFWQLLVNRKSASKSFRPTDAEADMILSHDSDSEYAEEYQTIVRFQRIGGGDSLNVILSVECGHCPIVRVFAQYWVIDKTGFGCRFSESSGDFLRNRPDIDTSRRSFVTQEERRNSEFAAEMKFQGHQWSIGMNGMSIFFSRKKKFAISVETGVGARQGGQKRNKDICSKWAGPFDVSNVLPKTIFAIDELNGKRRFEMAISVKKCEGMFSRTKMIVLVPRYQVVNLLHRELVVAQEGCITNPLHLNSQSAAPLHWEDASIAPTILFGVKDTTKGGEKQSYLWTTGKLRVDRVGLSAIRLPTPNDIANVPLVVQAEVKLASKEQPCAAIVTLWIASVQTNPLYVLRNLTPYTLVCHQRMSMEHEDSNAPSDLDRIICRSDGKSLDVNCGADMSTNLFELLDSSLSEEFVWIVRERSSVCFGFDDPGRSHAIEWSCFNDTNRTSEKMLAKSIQEIDTMGSSSLLSLPDGTQIRCQIIAERSTKIIEFTELRLHASPSRGKDSQTKEESIATVEDDILSVGINLVMSGIVVSVIDNVRNEHHGREISLIDFGRISASFYQSFDGYHEIEFRLQSFQIDNHIRGSTHPILLFSPRVQGDEPFLHISAVRRLQRQKSTHVFRYIALRLLEVELYLDRRTVETVARFIDPAIVSIAGDEQQEQPDWIARLTEEMSEIHENPESSKSLKYISLVTNPGRVYVEQLHLHPIRIGLTFTQEWTESDNSADSILIFQFIRGMGSISNAPLLFTSFMVGHAFESPQELIRVIATHYLSQLTQQIFGILGSLAILGAPVDFIKNVGTGLVDFFYEPINGAVHGPRQFIEGLETGTQSLARGIFVGVVRGAANVTEAINTNLAGLTADDNFVDERNAYRRMLADAMSRSGHQRSLGESFALAGASLVRGIRSGATGIIEQPAEYVSRHGPFGFIKGFGKAMVGAVVKPIVGCGDAAVLVMNHASDATSRRKSKPRVPKRLRRALPCRSNERPNNVMIQPYDEKAAKAQKIVTGGESVADEYVGHVNIPSHLIIASQQCLWAIDRHSREPWYVNWEDLSHFSIVDNAVRVAVFSQTGLRTFMFQVNDTNARETFRSLLSMQHDKMVSFELRKWSGKRFALLTDRQGNSYELSTINLEPDSFSKRQIVGMKSQQVTHVFGTFNGSKPRLSDKVKNEVDLIEQCNDRVHRLTSESSTFLQTLDVESWFLIHSWGQLFSGLSSRRCLVAGIINGTGGPIQVKSSKLIEGGSACYSIATEEYDRVQGVLHPGGCILFFGWGIVPNLSTSGNVCMQVETNALLCSLADQKDKRYTYAEATPGYQVGFLEKSYDESGWWAKYWLLVRSTK